MPRRHSSRAALEAGLPTGQAKGPLESGGWPQRPLRIQGTWLMRLHGVGPTRTLASEGKSEPVPKAPVSSMLQSDPGACDVTVAAVMTGVRDRS